MDRSPNYWRVFLTFARNSLVRDMTFRANFLIECLSSMSWVLMNVGFYVLIFRYTPMIGDGTGWGQYQFFIFLATTLFVTSIVQALFMPNAEEFSELIRRGDLDFVLLKPIDTQFLVSLHRMNWSSLANFVFGAILLVYSLYRLNYVPGLLQCVLYPIYVACGIAIMYSLMISMAAVSVWMGRNQSLYNFWFYITNFSRYPMEIYRGTWGDPLRWTFTFILPVLIVVNVPARLIVKPLEARPLAVAAIFYTVGCLVVSRWVFHRALISYRSASS